jgi:hypothetical protein
MTIATSANEIVSIPVEGMTCASCVISSVAVVSNALRLRRFVAPRLTAGTLAPGGSLPVVQPEPS